MRIHWRLYFSEHKTIAGRHRSANNISETILTQKQIICRTASMYKHSYVVRREISNDDITTSTTFVIPNVAYKAKICLKCESFWRQMRTNKKWSRRIYEHLPLICALCVYIFYVLTFTHIHGWRRVESNRIESSASNSNNGATHQNHIHTRTTHRERA